MKNRAKRNLRSGVLIFEVSYVKAATSVLIPKVLDAAELPRVELTLLIVRFST